MNYKRHIYCLLISLVMIGVTVPFHPGIPWTAWAGAFVLFMLESEVLLSMINRDRDDEGRATDDIRRRRSRREAYDGERPEIVSRSDQRSGQELCS